MDQASVVGMVTCYRLDSLGMKSGLGVSGGGARFSAPFQTGPSVQWLPDKAAGAWC